MVNIGRAFASALLVLISCCSLEGQELLKGTEGIIFLRAEMSPDNRQVLALASRDKGDVLSYDDAVLIDRKQGKSTVLLSSSEGLFGGHQVSSAIFSPSGKHVLAGGSQCWYCWSNPGLTEWFVRKGTLSRVHAFMVVSLAASKEKDFVAINLVDQDEDETGRFVVSEITDLGAPVRLRS